MDKLFLPLREGQTVRVFQKIIEGKRERNVPFIGLLLKVRGSGINKTITVKQTLDGIDVEKIFPIQLPTITKIEIVEEQKTTGPKKASGKKKARARRKAAKK